MKKMMKNRIVRTKAGSEKYGVPIGQPIPRKDQFGRPITILIGGQTLVNVHPPDKCAGEFCTIHHPSNHHMKDWPQNWRADRGIMERLCGCGIGHPDPDDPKIKLPGEGIHGCCGHCRVPIYGEFTCESCQYEYFTSPEWDDECYCKGCYFELFPTPNE